MKKIMEIRRGESVPEGARWLKEVVRDVGTKQWTEDSEYGGSAFCVGPDYQPFDVFEVKDSDTLTEFYELLKFSIKGRVVNGNMDGCILESELKEIYEHFRRSRD